MRGSAQAQQMPARFKFFAEKIPFAVSMILFSMRNASFCIERHVTNAFLQGGSCARPLHGLSIRRALKDAANKS